jgi:hypothetical protein
MDLILFENLLREEESAVLDFKRDQYPFSSASDAARSELLKDLLGFANAWRRTDAYILIGIGEAGSSGKELVGVREHLQDHSLQQFVNGLTNRPVRFHYEAFRYADLDMGVLRIDLAQPRPIYLKRPFGKLKARDVYVRRGSSTDPQAPASPEEIAEMGRGQSAGAIQPEVLVRFADPNAELSTGTCLTFEAKQFLFPDRREIPTFSPGGEYISSFSMGSPNENYFRDFCDYIAFASAYQKIRLLIENTGTTAAQAVRIEIDANKTAQVALADRAPDRPRRFWSVLAHSDALAHIRASIPTPGDLEVIDSGPAFRAEIECGNMQPGRRIWSDSFYIAAGQSGRVELAGRVFASNLARPAEFSLAIDATIDVTKVPVKEIYRLVAAAERAEDELE